MAGTLGCTAASCEATEDPRKPNLRPDSLAGTAAFQRTLWDEFIEQREESTRPFIKELMIKMLVEWSLKAVIIQAIIFSKEVASPLFYWTSAIKVMMLACFGFNLAMLSFDCCRHSHSRWVSVGVNVFALLHFTEGVGSDVLNRKYKIFDKEHVLTEGAVFSSEMLGAHQVLFLLIILSNARLLLHYPQQHLLLYCSLVLVCHVIGLVSILYDGELSYVTVSIAEYFRVLIPLTVVSITNAFGSHLRLYDDWASFVLHKRLQLACIRSEELLALAMPRDFAHELMVGDVRTQTHSMVSLAFLYVPDYDEMMSNNGDTFESMRKIHRLYCQLDELVLVHSKVYKVESVGGCYLVACGVPFTCSNHAETLMSFCMEAVELCNASDNSYRQSIMKNRGLKLDERLLESWDLKVGLHCGPVATGSCGKLRMFFRVFGDAVNTASRVASSARAGEVLTSKDFYDKGLGNPPLGKSIASNSCAVPYTPTERKVYFLKGKGDSLCYRFRVDRTQPWRTSSGATTEKQIVREEKHEISNLIGNESPSYGFETKRSFTCSKLEQAFLSYKTLSPTILLSRKGYFLNEIESSYLKKFISKFLEEDDNDGSNESDPPTDQPRANGAQDTTPNALLDHSNQDAGLESSQNEQGPGLSEGLQIRLFSASHVLSAKFSPLHRMRLQFGHDRTEQLYQQNAEAAVYRNSKKSAGWLLGLLVCFLSIYSRGLQDHPWTFAFVSITVGGAVVYMHMILDKFSDLWNKMDVDLDKSLQVSEILQEVTMDTGWKVYFKQILSRFSTWMTILAWITIAAFSMADQVILRKLHPLHSPGETSLHSLALPTVLLSVFQIFPPTLGGQFSTQVVGVLFFVLIQYPTFYFHETPRSIFWIGIYYLLSTAYNAAMNGYLQDVNFRRSFVRQRASIHAKSQSDVALTQLYPQNVISRLKRDLRMPFQDHTQELVVLQADLVGFTYICTKLDASHVRLLLDNLYSQFDDVISHEGLWKMDTIGDAYVAVGGLVGEVDRPHLVERVLHCATRMVRIVKDFKAQTRHNVGIRIGVHAGKATSGVLGRLRPRFHVFGETMRYVGKLEQRSRRNQIHISEDAVALYKLNEFHFVESHEENSADIGEGSSRTRRQTVPPPELAPVPT